MLCPVCQSPNPDAAQFCTSCGSPLPSNGADFETPVLKPRTSLRGGAFVIEELLGVGGFGLTYRARESALGREVAVKEFFPFGSTRKEEQVVPPINVAGEDWRRELSAFRDEALTLARFSHPAIVRAYAVWAENGTAYFAMEFLRGQSLQKRLDSGQPLPVDEALSIVESIGEALARVHETGLLHRDIKPDNILLCDGRTVLIDFGTAREFASDKTTPMTQLLTPGYAPLEQYGRRARFGPFTDVYALAATLYHALSGHAPPPAPDRAAGVDLRPLDELNPRVSRRLAQAIETAMEVAVPKRPQTVDAWLDSLREAQKPLPVVIPPPAVVVPPTAPAPAPVTPIIPPETFLPGIPRTSTLPEETSFPSPSPRLPPQRQRSSSPDTVYPDAIEIPPEARIPSWFWGALVLIVLVFGWYQFLYDPVRGDLQSFDASLRPVLAQSSDVQSKLAGAVTPNAVNAWRLPAILTQQQSVISQLRSLNSTSDEALFVRDQLVDAEEEKLKAIEEVIDSREPSQLSGAYDALLQADQQRAVWRSDYDYLKSQHRLR